MTARSASYAAVVAASLRTCSDSKHITPAPTPAKAQRNGVLKSSWSTSSCIFPGTPSETPEPKNSSAISGSITPRTFGREIKYDPLNLTQPTTALNSPSERDSTAAEQYDQNWWLDRYHSLAALSQRSYHFSCAASYIRSPAEEIHLLQQVVESNAEGRIIYEEMVNAVKARGNLDDTDRESIADWEKNYMTLMESDVTWNHRIDELLA